MTDSNTSISNKKPINRVHQQIYSKKEFAIDEIINLIEKKIQLEETYALGLQNLSVVIGNIRAKGVIQKMLTLMKQSQLEKAKGVFQLIRNLNQAILDPLKTKTRPSLNSSDVFFINLQKFEKEARESLEKCKQAQFLYTLSIKSYEHLHLENECAKICEKNQQNKKHANEKVSHINNTISTARSDMVTRENNYKNNVLEYAVNIKKFKEEMAKIRDCIDLHQKEIIGQFKTYSMNLMRFEMFNAKTLNTEMAELASCVDDQFNMEANDEEIDSKEETYPSMEYIPYKSFYGYLLQDNEGNITTPYEEKILGHCQQYFAMMMKSVDQAKLNEAKPKDLDAKGTEDLCFLTEFFMTAWKASGDIKESLSKFAKLIKEKLYVKACIRMLNQFRISGNSLLTLEGYDNMASILNLLLDSCYKFRNPVLTKKLMMISLTFYKHESYQTSPKSNQQQPSQIRVFLGKALVKHQIWKENDLWTAAIMHSIREEYLLQKAHYANGTETEEDTSLRVKNIIYGQLASYASNMIVFEYDKTETKNLIIKFCKIFSLPEHQIKDLNAVIETAIKENHFSVKETYIKSQASPTSHNSSQLTSFESKSPIWSPNLKSQTHPLQGSHHVLNNDCIQPNLNKKKISKPK